MQVFDHQKENISRKFLDAVEVKFAGDGEQPGATYDTRSRRTHIKLTSIDPIGPSCQHTTSTQLHPRDGDNKPKRSHRAPITSPGEEESADGVHHVQLPHSLHDATKAHT